MAGSAARKSTNLTVDAQLIAQARELDINISRAAEDGIAKAVAVERARLWKIENRAAIESWNRFVEANGPPLKPLWED